jgi:hypothetical protein
VSSAREQILRVRRPARYVAARNRHTRHTCALAPRDPSRATARREDRYAKIDAVNDARR